MKKRVAIKVAKKLGFTERPRKEIQFVYRHEGKLIATTAVPKGRGDLRGRLSHAFRNQLHLDQKQLSLAIKCPFKARDYLQHLEENGLLE